MIKALNIKINGIVQGVGFRPFIYKLAQEMNICGWVNNFSSGVEIHAEGENTEEFAQKILLDKPPMALIISLDRKEATIQGYGCFEILASQESAKKDVLISPDIAVCRDCLREMKDPKDRRYRYPFTNCTNCGPRYTIIKDRPYDRDKTTMDPFGMCPECRREYEDPIDRRFHAQPVACAICGPSLQLWDTDGAVIKDHGIGIDLLQAGSILAVKGLGGYHLVCDAYNDHAVNRLRKVKERGAKPFAVMARDITAAKTEVVLSELESETLSGPSAPIVLLPRKDKEDSRLSQATAPGLNTLGVMLPYTPVHHLLFEGGFDFLVMTSANLSGQPLIYDNYEALEGLRGIADYFLVNDRDIYHPCDDSVMQRIGDKMTFIRRARGYVPVPLFLKNEIKDPIVGLGGEMKNAFCLASGNMAFMSQYIGDMHGLDNLERFEQEFVSFQKVTSIVPKITASDLHPEYTTSRIAKVMDGPKCKVQHHHAHLVSVMAEHGIAEPSLGLICDGTGYGEDGRIWGFEYLFGNAKGYQRLGHLEYLPLPGGDAGAKYPLRIAFAYLNTVMTDEEWQSTQSLWTGLSSQERNILEGQMRSGFQLFETSSAGRLFDAVSGMLGVCREVTYEGQAAIELESVAAAWLRQSKSPAYVSTCHIEPCDDGTTNNLKDSLLYKCKEEALLRLSAVRQLRERYEGSAYSSGTEIKNIESISMTSIPIVAIGSFVEEGNKIAEKWPAALYSSHWEIVSEGTYPVVILKIDRLLKQILGDVLIGSNNGETAFRFHYSLACMMLETAILLGLKHTLPISGGVFQNKLLTECLLSLAGELGITILYQTALPSGDGGLALGQVFIANAQNLDVSDSGDI